jgi:hypothetical protein
MPISLRQLVLLLFVASACSSGNDVPQNLDNAAKIVELALKPAALEQSTYAVVLPNGTPKQFVSWYFSTLGVAEWPPSEDSPGEESALPVMKRPHGVRYYHTGPDSSGGNQIVLKWDDGRNVVIVEGYLDPRKPPVLVRELPLPKVTSKNELARATAETTLQMGGTYQAF